MMHTYASTVSVGIAGASGYAGQELLRLLARHPAARLTGAMTSSAGSGARPLPRLNGVWDGTLTPLDLDLLAGAEAVFLAVPEEASAELVPALQARGVARIFDLSGAFRLRDRELRGRWYPAATADPGSLGVVYGLTELARAEIPRAKVVACPGCYPTAALLALDPLARAGLLADGIVIDAKSGISGAGRTPTERTHFSEVHGSLSAYGVFAHRHAAEIEQQLGPLGNDVTFVPHLVPIDRGILETIYARVRAGVTAFDIESAYAAAYSDAPFVRLTGDALPEIKHVAHTNFCDIGWRLDAATRRLVIVSCIDNLVKGAAGQAVQNFNVAFGLDETAGLL